jgi:hypothetical protein
MPSTILMIGTANGDLIAFAQQLKLAIPNQITTSQGWLSLGNAASIHPPSFGCPAK